MGEVPEDTVPQTFRDDAFKTLKGALIGTGISGAVLTSSALAKDVEGTLSKDDLEVAYSTISSGQVYRKENFLSPELSMQLQKDIQLRVTEGRFVTAGLTNRALKTQEFDRSKDREVSPIDLNNDKSSKSMELVGKIVRNLQSQLALLLDRPTLAMTSDNTGTQCAHECYFSRSLPGALLPRHVDERHEEIKGRKGWSTPSRRSISWLIYLSSQDIQAGELRSFPQKLPVAGRVGADDGNLQVGWLVSKESDKVMPVFLDCWRENGLSAALYHTSLPPSTTTITTATPPLNPTSDTSKHERHYITDNFPLRDEYGNFKTIPTLSNLINKQGDGHGGGGEEATFYAIEDIQRWHAGDIPAGSKQVDFLPTRGSLVVFDSVSLPHEVLPTTRGERLALAGWFHELQQVHPL